MRSPLLAALALVVSCSDSGPDGASVEAGPQSEVTGRRVVQIDPYSFDDVVDRLFETSNALRVRAPGPRNEVIFSIVEVAEDGDTGDGSTSSTVIDGDLDMVVTVELETFEIGDERSRRIHVRTASMKGDRGFSIRCPVDHMLPDEIGAISSGMTTSSRKIRRGDAHVLRDWNFTHGTESERIRVEMTIDAPD